MKPMPFIRISLALGSFVHLLYYSSCLNEDEPGYNQAINPIWEYDFKVGLSVVMNPIVHEDRVLFSSYEEPSPDLSANEKIVAFDKATGELLWDWSDYFWQKYEHIDPNSTKPILNNTMVFAIGSRNYAINLLNGETVWKNQTAPSFCEVTRKENKIYRVDTYEVGDIGVYSDQLLEAEINTGAWKKIFEVTGGDSLAQGLTVPAFYTSNEGDEMLLMANSVIIDKPTTSSKRHYVTPYLISYNLTKSKINYQIQLDNSGLTARVDWYPQIEGNNVYLLVASLMVCRNIHTGELIWQRRFNGDFLFSRVIIVDGRIYANRDGYDPTLYCMDAKTGSIIWETPSAGTASPLQFHKGVLYFVGGSTGKLHIVNASTGKFLYSINAPSSYKYNNDSFARNCRIDKETGRLYVASYTTAYCYPTVEVE